MVITPLSMGLEMAVAFGAAVYAAIHEVSHDSLFTALVLSASKPWLVEPVSESIAHSIPVIFASGGFGADFTNNSLLA